MSIRPNLVAAFWMALAIPSIGNCADIQSHLVERSDTVLIFVSGEIKVGDDEVFRNLALKHDKAIVVLDSPGGAVDPALDMGKAIHLKEFDTVVTDKSLCTSACALIWLAGSHRYLSPGGRLGFHASYRKENGVAVESGLANAMVGHYLSQLNLPSKAAVFATLASPDKILWLNDKTKEASGITFERFADVDAAGDSARATQSAPQPRVADPATPRTLQPTTGTDTTKSLGELNQLPKAWMERWLAKDGFDITKDGKVWINADHYGDQNDYALAAADLYGATGRRRKAWVRGYHRRNPDVAYRESKTLIQVDCGARSMMIELAAYFDSKMYLIEKSGQTPWEAVIPGTYSERWFNMLCE